MNDLNDALEQLTRKLAKARVLADERGKEVDALVDQVHALPLYKKMLEAREREQEAKKAASEADDALREHALLMFETSGLKKLNNAVEVKERAVVIVPDQNRAEDWAKNNAPMVFKFDRKAFDSLVKAISVPDEIAQLAKQPYATISKDLSGWS